MKLTYFSGRGKAEVARLILAVGEADYENIRVKAEEWPKMKENMPLEQLPVLELEDGGTVLAQSNAICRFLAKKYGLYAADDVEQARIDMVIDHIEDLMNVLMKVAYPRDEGDRRVQAKEINELKLPKFVRLAEKMLNKNGGKYFVGDKMTWADIAMFQVVSALTDPTDPLFTKYMKNGLGDGRLKALDDAPALRGLKEAVGADPRIKKWMEARPKNEEEGF